MSAGSAIGLRIEKIVALLGSDSDGEKLAAIDALGRTLAAVGMDFVDAGRSLASVICGEKRPRCRDAPRRRSVRTWRTMTDAERLDLLDNLSGKKLSGWEYEFTTSIRTAFRHRWDRLSSAQLEAMDRLILKHAKRRK